MDNNTHLLLVHESSRLCHMMFNHLYLLFLLCFCTDFSHGHSDDVKLFRNDYTYIEAGKSFYKIHTTPQSWFDAKLKCDEEGTSFYYPTDDKEAKAVMSFRNGSEPNILKMFVGISDIVSEGIFETIDGKSVSELYDTWTEGEPNDDLGDQDCVLQDMNGELSDHQCFDKFPFICTKSLLSLEQNQINRTGQKDEFFREDYSYIPEVESFYKLHKRAQPWAAAKLECAKEGASLYYPVSEDEQNAVTSFLNRTYPDAKWLYLGISDIETEGVYQTIDGKSLSEVYSNWKPNEPNNKNGNEDCVEQDITGKMNDCSCSNNFLFICKKGLERPAESPKPNYGCGIDYSFNKDIGKCYKLHTTPLKWTGAYVVCRAEQAHLAVINNQLEAEFLSKLVMAASQQDNSGHHRQNRGMYHLGFRYGVNEGWRTVKGAPMKVNEDAWWDGHLPIVDERPQCGSMFYNGRLNSINCDTKSFFICDHEVEQSSIYQKPSIINITVTIE